MFIKSIFTSSFSLLNYIQKLKLKQNKTKYTKTKTHHFYLFNHLFIIPNSSMHSKPIPNILPWPNHVSTKGMFTNFIITIICFIEEGSMNWFGFIYLAHVIKTTKFTNSESPIFWLLAWSTVRRNTMQFINWNHATFSNSF